MSDEHKVRYRIENGGVWYAGVAGTRDQCARYANDLWKAGAAEIEIYQMQMVVIARKSRAK